MAQRLTAPNLLDLYMENGATQGFEPIPLTSCKLSLSGRHGRGKTTFVMSIPGALVFDYDQGATQCIQQNAVRIPMVDSRGKGKLRSWDLHDKQIDLLAKHADRKDRPFGIVVFDTLDSWFFSEVMRATFEYNKNRTKNKIKSVLDLDDYGAGRAGVYDSIRSTLRTLHAVGYGWIVISHIAAKRQKVPGSDVEVVSWLPTMGGALPDYINQDAEIVAQIDRHTRKIKQNGVRKEVTKYKILFSTNDDYADAKTRLRLPESEVIIPEGKGWECLNTAYEAGIAEAQAKVQALTGGLNEGDEEDAEQG